MSDTSNLIFSGAIGAVVTAVATPIAICFARRMRIMDLPGGYKAHARATPLLGGVAVAIGFLAALLWLVTVEGARDWTVVASLFAGGFVVLVAGLLDDVHGLSPGRKLVWQLGAALVAALVLTGFDVRLRLFLGWDPVPLAVLTVLWIVAVINAINFLDNMNGLCAGLGAVAAASFAACNLRTGEVAVALACAALSGACLGFLPYNWPKARVFLGDTGSMLIGVALAALSVMGVYTPGAQVPWLAVVAPLFVMAVPLLDAVLVVCIRLRDGHPPWFGDRRHISHRLVRRGMRPAVAVATLWAASAACGVAAVLLPTFGPTEASLLVALLACALGALAVAAGTTGLP